MSNILPCHKYLKPGFKYGRTGTCHLYTLGDIEAMKRALKRAQNDKKYEESKRAKQQRMFFPRWLFE